MRTSRTILLVAVVLVAVSVHTGLHGLGLLASLAHGTDVHRDDIAIPLERMFDAGAIDYDRAAAAVGMPARLDGSDDQRQAFEQDVRWRSSRFLADAVVRRVGRERSEVASRVLWVSATCFAAACALAFLSRRVARAERAGSAPVA